MVMSRAAVITVRTVPLLLCAGIGSIMPPGVCAQETSSLSGISAPSGLLGKALLLSNGPAPDNRAPQAWKAALASLVVPGSGQIWTGRRGGWGFVAAEVVLVGGGVWAGSRGRGRQGEYERFADQYWDRDRYLEYIATYEAVTGSQWPYDHHTLPPDGTRCHDYYEMIGKYEQFAPGWDDWSAWYDVSYRGKSTHRDSYLQMRLEANRYLKWALTAGGLVFLNHVAASAEALVWGLRGGERPKGRSSVGTSPWKAALSSLLLPGWGQRQQGNRGLANLLVTVEGAFWGGLVGFNKYSVWKMEDSRRWAAIHAGVYLAGKDDAYFQYLALYPDLTTHNAAQLSGLGDPSAVYPAGAGYEWRWSSEAAWKRYRELRRDSRLVKNYATLALGGIVAGRLVGAVTALVYGMRSGSSETPSRLSREYVTGPGIRLRVAPLFTSYPGGVYGLQLITAIR